jgi:hypothetical protein
MKSLSQSGRGGEAQPSTLFTKCWSWLSLCGERMAQPVQPRENNNTSHHLKEASSKLKLIAFPEKSFWTKQLNSSSLSCPANWRAWQLFTYQFLAGPLQRSWLPPPTLSPREASA